MRHLPDPRFRTNNRVAYDRRTRVHKMWVKKRGELLAELGREPGPGELGDIEALADVEVMIQIARMHTHRGLPVGDEHLRGLLSERRRYRMCLGLAERAAKPTRRDPDDLADLLAADTAA